MKPTIYKPSIYKGAGIYKVSAGGGEIQKKQIYGQHNLYMVDSNGYIGFTISNGDTIICIVDTTADYSGLGLGQVKFYDKQINNIQINGLDFKTTIINGVEWLAQNFDLYTDEMGVNAVWYNNNENLYGRNGKNYGMLYNKDGVDVVRNNINNWAPGWRVPDKSDYNKLIDDCGISIAGKCLAGNVGGFNGFGTDNFYFNARPAGYYASDIFDRVENRVVYPLYNGSLEFYIVANQNDVNKTSTYLSTTYCSLRLCRNVI